MTSRRRRRAINDTDYNFPPFNRHTLVTRIQTAPFLPSFLYKENQLLVVLGGEGKKEQGPMLQSAEDEPELSEKYRRTELGSDEIKIQSYQQVRCK